MVSKNKDDCIMAATKPLEDLTLDQANKALFDAITTIMLWMPQESRSKAILVADPRDATKLIAIHTGPNETQILIDEDYTALISILCDDCIAKLKPYSIIYTGIDCATGKLDPEAFIGLAGGHDEDQEEFDVEMDDDDLDEDDMATPTPKRMLN
jgi:hypothetical protein